MSDVKRTTSGSTNNTTGANFDNDPAISGAKKNTEEFTKAMGDAKKNFSPEMAYYLELQEKMMKEQQAYTALSNVMKARSDAAMNAARNIK
jgi:hypothetical protein